MRLAIALVLLTVNPWAAQAYTCAQVREYVRTHTKEEIEAMRRTMSQEQVEQALRCLRRRA